MSAPGLLKILAVPHHDGVFDWILAVLLCTLPGSVNVVLVMGLAFLTQEQARGYNAL